MKISWGWRIMVLYAGFVVMMICLVVASGRQKVDLVSKDYYKDEIAYQDVLDASRNQSNLAGSLSKRSNEHEITIDFPNEFNNTVLKGVVSFYSAVDQDWDKNFTINTNNNKLVIPREQLRHTIYTVKVSYSANGRNFYYETQINLNAG